MAEGQFYIAFVDAEDTTFEAEYLREDVTVASFSISHQEGDFAIFSMTIKNPLTGLLSPARKRYVWVSWHGPDGIEPLIFGRIVGVPADINKMRTVITVRARPDDYEELKSVLAESLKVAPYWDAVWINPDSKNDPDMVLQARTARYHIDRITHEVTISDLLVPEDGVLEFDEDVVAETVNITYAGAGISTVHVRAEIGFTQRANGILDVSKNLADAFATAGTTHSGMVSSYSWEHLASSWPLPNDDIGGGWKWQDSNVEIGNNRWVSTENRLINTLSMWANTYIGGEEGGAFPIQPFEEQVGIDVTLGVMKPTMISEYTAERSRIEIIEFDVVSDVQPVLSDPGSDAPIQISLSSNDVGEPIEIDESGNTITPLIDARRNTYMKTDRGVQSMNYLMARARAELIDNARIVHITFQVPFHHIINVSLRKSAILYDARLPGGQATGKIINYVALGDTTTGRFDLTITIACAIGYGGSVASVVGTPTYVDEGYVDVGYQDYDNAITLLGTGDLTYDDYRNYIVDDDGIDFFNPRVEDMLLSAIVTNGPEQQAAQLETSYTDVPQAEVALANVRTQVCMDFKPVVGGPFETLINVTTYPLVIPKQIDLEAA